MMQTNYTSLFRKFLFIVLSATTGTALAQSEFGNWDETQLTENEISHRHENAFVEVNGKLYLLGGRGPQPVEIYDPETDTWTTGATGYQDISASQIHHFQAVAVGSKIYAICGFDIVDGAEVPTPNVYIYDTETDTWSDGPEIPAHRRRGSAGAVVYNGKIYIVAGIQNGHIDGHVEWFDEFDPQTGEWRELPDAPRARDHFHAAIAGGKLVAAGGRLSKQDDPEPGGVFIFTIPEVDIYDFSTDEWTTTENPIITDRAGTATVTVGNEIVVLGGEGPHQESAPDGGPYAHNEVEAFHIESEEWRELPSLNTGRHGTQAAVYNDKVYIVAGSSRRGGNVDSENEALTLEVIEFSMTEDLIEPEPDEDEDEGEVTAIQANTPDSPLNIFPNPAVDNINIELSGGQGFTVEVYSPDGRLESVSNHSGSTGNINLSGLAKGMHYLKVIGNHGEIYEMYKIVKQ
ncbi:T9SS type A sorting domain-containing protein [Cytophagaceae bacterium ABcell3]|nr:T9SS type A sorting domain-containing protein [Cytophagaceae bacterium ABcell3]